MSTEIYQVTDPKEREKYFNSILYEKYFSFDSWADNLKDALSEHLGYVKTLFPDSPDQYQLYSLLVLGSIYSIDRDEESARKHREMLFDHWCKDCRSVCGEDVVEAWKSTARMMVQKNVVCPAKRSVNIDVSCDKEGKVSYTYRSIDIQNASGNTILLPAWQLVDSDYLRRWRILHNHLDERKLQDEGGDDAADMSAIPYIERIDMDISDILQDSDASNFEDSEEEIKPGESFDATYENVLPSDALWMPDAGDIFGVRYYQLCSLEALRVRSNWY